MTAPQIDAAIALTRQMIREDMLPHGITDPEAIEQILLIHLAQAAWMALGGRESAESIARVRARLFWEIEGK